MDSELKRFEAELERLSPGNLPEGLIARMEAAMEGWEEVADAVSQEIDKVVPFPKLEAKGAREERGRGSLWAAAASVALLGAVAGIVLSATPGGGEVAPRRTTFVPAEGVSNIEFAPQTAKRRILDTSDQDIIVTNGAKTYRVSRLNYVDRYEFLGGNGEKMQVEFPAVNFRVTPVVTD